MIARLLILFRLALANVFASALNVLVGLVLLFGAALLVVGGALFSTLDDSLSKSVVDSIAGHIQIYGAKSKDPLEIYGKMDGSDSNLSPIDDYPALKAKVLEHPNVARIVPMGGTTALVGSGNTVDITLEKLRTLYRNQKEAQTALPAEEFAQKSKSLQQHVRNIVAVLVKDVAREAELTDGSAIDPRQREALATASTDAFWSTFENDPYDHLELLENRVAPLVSDADMLFLRCLGTDLEAFQAAFSRMAIVEGGPVPSGHRGVLLPRFFVEEYLKLKNARRLDKIRDAREAGRRIADTEDKDLQRFIRENQSQTREIVLQLDGEGTALATQKLQTFLSSQEPDLAKLLSSFYGVTDETFDERYAFFYKELAPMLTLYRAKVGDMITLRSFGRSGGAESVVLKVYGIFELRGLEKSPIAGANAMIDLVSFRDLYGFLSSEKKAELDAMKAATNARQIDRDSAEDELFGESATVEHEATAQKIDVKLEGGKKATRTDTFPPSEIDNGIVLHTAVLLKDGSDRAQAETLAELERKLSDTKPKPDPARIAAAKALVDSGRLGMGLGEAMRQLVAIEEARVKGEEKPANVTLLAAQDALKTERAALNAADLKVVTGFIESARPASLAVSWTNASGFFGKFIDFFRMLLVGIIVSFAFIALIVVALGMTIATVQRTQTIGTMRAIGAQRSFVVSLIMTETVVLAAVFGVVGTALGALIVSWLHARGIPAFKDELYFFFSGPVLRPVMNAAGVALALAVIVVVSLLAVLLPTYLATRVPPIRAMQPTE